MTHRTRAFLDPGLALLAWTWLAAIPAPAASPLVWQQQGEGCRFASLPVPATGRPGFTLLKPTQTGIAFSNLLSDATVAQNRLLEIGSGVALGDVDGDGWVDIYFCRLEGDNALYRNLGNWKFEDITARAGVGCPGQFSTGCVLADLDGDGDLDLLVNSLGGGTRVFFNDGHGQFTEKTDTGLARRFGATSMALADVEGDGDLDLYVTNYRTDTFHDQPPGLRLQTRPQPDGTVILEPRERFVGVPTLAGGMEAIERGEPDMFYVNREGRRFVPVPWKVGLFLDEEGAVLSTATTDWGLAVMFRDLNGDGLPDLYVSNDFVFWKDRVWLNQGGKRFQAPPRSAFRCFSLSSMVADVADINRDGFDDIFVADMLSPRRESRAWQRPDTLDGTVSWPIEDPGFAPEVTHNTLQVARGDGTFAEVARLAGVSATDWTWSAVFLDVDLDGWEDLLIANGSNHDVQDTDVMGQIARSGGWGTPEQRLRNLAKLPRRSTPSMALRNRHDLTFEDRSTAWGFDATGVAQGMAMADLDNDGDLDVVINCLNAPARVYRNESTAPRLALRLRGARANTRGIGAKMKVIGGPVTQTQEMIAGGRYLSGDDAMRVFAAGEARELEVEITWRNGQRSVVKGVKPNRVYEIIESATPPAPPAPPAPAPPAPLFEEILVSFQHTHTDALFNDFERQLLLPRKLSTLGPGIGWADADGDGHDDLIIGGGKEGRLAIFRGDGHGGMTEWTNAPWPRSNVRDQTTVLLWQGPDGGARLLAGESNWEDADTNAPPFRQFGLDPNSAPPAQSPRPSQLSSTGPLALADVDGDGQLDLFVGGRVIAGRYPEPADSHLLRQQAGAFAVAQSFPALGLVSGAVFTDLDGDGDPDLALACEWGPIHLLRNDGGKLIAWNPAVRWPDAPSLGVRFPTLEKMTGWWNGVAAGDFDGDGRMDLAISNWGRNWRTDQPPNVEIAVQLFYGDFADNGIVQTLLASADPWLSKVTPWRERKAVVAAIPAVAERFPTHHLYGRASVEEVLGGKSAAARRWEGAMPDSMVLLNRGDYFEARPLPIEAQFSPAFGISVGDWDGDGHEDLFLAQNFFGVDAETARQDAGAGLVLLGDGRGRFRALRPQESGIAIYGEQRGSAVADMDGDGRADLAVAQHGGATRLFRNARGKPGLRVTLRGPKGNPTGVGAMVRLKFGDRFGPAREIHAGSGYWSQDSATLVLAAPTAPDAVQVRWPGGQARDWPWPMGAKAVEVSGEGVKPR